MLIRFEILHTTSAGTSLSRSVIYITIYAHLERNGYGIYQKNMFSISLHIPCFKLMDTKYWHNYIFCCAQAEGDHRLKAIACWNPGHTYVSCISQILSMSMPRIPLRFEYFLNWRKDPGMALTRCVCITLLKSDTLTVLFVCIDEKCCLTTTKCRIQSVRLVCSSGMLYNVQVAKLVAGFSNGGCFTAQRNKYFMNVVIWKYPKGPIDSFQSKTETVQCKDTTPSYWRPWNSKSLSLWLFPIVQIAVLFINRGAIRLWHGPTGPTVYIFIFPSTIAIHFSGNVKNCRHV